MMCFVKIGRKYLHMEALKLHSRLINIGLTPRWAIYLLKLKPSFIWTDCFYRLEFFLWKGGTGASCVVGFDIWQWSVEWVPCLLCSYVYNVGSERNDVAGQSWETSTSSVCPLCFQLSHSSQCLCVLCWLQEPQSLDDRTEPSQPMTHNTTHTTNELARHAWMCVPPFLNTLFVWAKEPTQPLSVGKCSTIIFFVIIPLSE